MGLWGIIGGWVAWLLWKATVFFSGVRMQSLSFPQRGTGAQQCSPGGQWLPCGSCWLFVRPHCDNLESRTRGSPTLGPSLNPWEWPPASDHHLPEAAAKGFGQGFLRTSWGHSPLPRAPGPPCLSPPPEGQGLETVLAVRTYPSRDICP